MPIAIVTGSAGLIGSEAARYFARQGFDVVGIDNDMRAYFFGPEASTAASTARLAAGTRLRFRTPTLDIRDREGVDALFAEHGARIELVVHTAAQPSHDWAAREPFTDFDVNAIGTLNLLRGRARALPRRAVRLHLHEQGLRRPPQRAAAGRAARRARSCPRTTGAYDGIDRDDVDRPLHALALRRVEGRRRRARAGVRALLRHADRRASAAAASPARSTPAPSCTASWPT